MRDELNAVHTPTFAKPVKFPWDLFRNVVTVPFFFFYLQILASPRSPSIPSSVQVPRKRARPLNWIPKGCCRGGFSHATSHQNVVIMVPASSGAATTQPNLEYKRVSIANLENPSCARAISQNNHIKDLASLSYSPQQLARISIPCPSFQWLRDSV
jgi:hypothetical protein